MSDNIFADLKWDVVWIIASHHINRARAAAPIICRMLDEPDPHASPVQALDALFYLGMDKTQLADRFTKYVKNENMPLSLRREVVRDFLETNQDHVDKVAVKNVIEAVPSLSPDMGKGDQK